MDPFHGTVNLAHWIRDKSGQQFNCVTGTISIAQAEEVWGFKVGRSESSWMVVVKGTDKEVAYIPGQEVYAIIRHGEEGNVNHDSLVLK